MRCGQCRRNRAHATNDLEGCRAHLHTYVETAKGHELKLDCWRAQQHGRALSLGLTAQVALVDRYLVDPAAPIRPTVVIVPSEQPRGAFDLRVFAYVGDQVYEHGGTHDVEDPAQMLVDAIEFMVDAIARAIVRDGARWAS